MIYEEIAHGNVILAKKIFLRRTLLNIIIESRMSSWVGRDIKDFLGKKAVPWRAIVKIAE